MGPCCSAGGAPSTQGPGLGQDGCPELPSPYQPNPNFLHFLMWALSAVWLAQALQLQNWILSPTGRYRL